MTYWEAILTLHTHFRLSNKRAKTWQANNVAKYLYYVLAVFLYGYMAWIGTELARLTAMENLGGYRFIYALLPLLLFFDYIFRYTTDHRLLMYIRPYQLLPLPKHTYTDYLIIRQLVHIKNTYLLFLCVPFGIKTIVPELGALAMTGYTIGLYLLLLVNGQFFQLTQVLTARRLYYWLIPILVYLSIAATAFFFPSAQDYIHRCARIGNAMMKGDVWIYVMVILLLVLLILLNRNILYRHIYKELYATSQTTGSQNSLSLSFFERFNQTGEYLKLETWAILRNKRLRLVFILDTVSIALFCVLIIINPENDPIETHSFLYYCFIIYGLAFLTRIMCYEGNYFECLLMQRHSIQTLLLAKYYFYSALLLIPLLIFLPAVILGKISMWEILAYTLFSAGVCYRILFQMAIYNKVTFSMNTTHTGKTSSSPYLHIIVTAVVILSALPIISLGTWWLKLPALSNTILSILGIIFIVTHRRWITGISRQMKEKQHEQLEGFKKSR